MKKFLRLTLIVMFCVVLVGCGNKKNDDTDKNGTNNPEDSTSSYQESGYTKLTDTLAGHSDAMKDIYDLKMTFYFKNDKAVNAQIVLTFKDEFKPMIANMKETLSKNSEYKSFVTGANTLTYDYTKEGFKSFDGLSKEKIKAALEESDYTFE